MGDVDSFLEEQLASVKRGPRKDVVMEDKHEKGAANGTTATTTDNGKENRQEGDAANEGSSSSSSSGSSSDGSSSDDSDDDEGEGEEAEGEGEGEEEEESGEGDDEEDEDEGEEEKEEEQEQAEEEEDTRRKSRERDRKRSRSRDRDRRHSSKRSRRGSSRDRSSRKDRHRDRDDREHRSSRRSRSRDRDRDSGRSSRRDRHEKDDKDKEASSSKTASKEASSKAKEGSSKDKKSSRGEDDKNAESSPPGKQASKSRDSDKERSKDKDKERSSRDKARSRSRDRDRDRESSRRHRDRDGRSSRRNDRGDRRDKDRDDRRDKDRDDRRGRDRRDRDRDDRRDRDRRDRDRDDSRRSRRRSRSPSKSWSRSPPSRRSERSEKSKEEREEAAKRAAIDELTRDQRTVFVNQLTMKVTEDDLTKYFGLLGEVNNVIMLRDKFTNRHKDGSSAMMSRGKPLPRHKGFAYVEMKSLEAVPIVLQLNDRVPDFQKFPVMVKASEAEKNYLAKQEEKAKNPGGANVILGNAAALAGLKLHIGNLHQNITEDDLGEICRSFGEVTQLILHRDEAGESKRFAFITFGDKDSATACLEKLDGLEVAGKALAVSHCKADPKTIPAAETPGNWKLDDDERASGMKMDSANRANIMAHLGGTAGAAMGGASAVAMGGIPDPNANAVASAAAAAAATTAAMNMSLVGIPGMGMGVSSGMAGAGHGLPGMSALPGMSGMGMMGAMGGGTAQSPSAAANAALEAALSGTAFGAGSAGAGGGAGGGAGAGMGMGMGMGLPQQMGMSQVGMPQMGLPAMGGQAPGQVTGQGSMNAALAAGLPGMPALGGTSGPEMAAAAVPAPAPAPAPAEAKPPVVGTPTFCLLVKNMFDPATETDEGWELDIKEEMEEECSKHGTVMHSYVETRQPGGLVYVMFSTTGAATASAEMLNGRWFAGRMVLVEYLAPQVYTAKFPEATKAAQTALATAANA